MKSRRVTIAEDLKPVQKLTETVQKRTAANHQFLKSQRVWRHQWRPLRPEPPMPLHLNDDEMSVLMSLAGPIDQQRRPQFLQEVAQELEAKRQAGEVGEGLVHRLARTIQRKYWDPPQISPNATAPVHRGRAA